MARKTLACTFLERVREQLVFLRDPAFGYRGLELYLAGAPQPWEFSARDEFEFHDGSGVLIVRAGPTGPAGHDNADVPEHVFRLDALVASRLV
jgi:hypothetical protein